MGMESGEAARWKMRRRISVGRDEKVGGWGHDGELMIGIAWRIVEENWRG